MRAKWIGIVAVVLLAIGVVANKARNRSDARRAYGVAASSAASTVKEIDPEKSPELASSYTARVSPAVIILDGNGKEARRFEDESKDTLASLQTELDRLPSKVP